MTPKNIATYTARRALMARTTSSMSLCRSGSVAGTTAFGSASCSAGVLAAFLAGAVAAGGAGGVLPGTVRAVLDR